jgi:hypothetical protein
MNPTFLAAVRSNRDPGAVIRTASEPQFAEEK